MEKVKILLLSGFLGAGKTTTALKLIDHLERKGITAVYIANDQGTLLIDADMGKDKGIVTRQVGNGCFCCKFEDLMDVVHSLIEDKKPDVIIAEAVGSCTDLVSTVIKPLHQFYGSLLEVLPFPVILDGGRYADMQRLMGSRLNYLFTKQIEDAQVICLSKSDSIPEADREVFIQDIHSRYPEKPVLTYSSVSGSGIEQLIEKLIVEPINTISVPETPLDIDYGIYGAAEADMAWVDMSLDITASGRPISPDDWIRTFLEQLKSQSELNTKLIGHIKIALSNGSALTKASLVNIHSNIVFDECNGKPADAYVALINARVEGQPEDIHVAIKGAVSLTEQLTETQTLPRKHNAFSPSMPTPVHRIQ